MEGVGLRERPLGARGERFAAKYLRKQGMKILAFNRTMGKGEIDLIAVEGEFLVFVEVRTRASEEFIKIQHTVRGHKQKMLRTTILKLVKTYGRAGLTPRVDIVAIHWPKGAKAPAEVRHYKNALPLARW